jgi:hypothetical protein
MQNRCSGPVAAKSQAKRQAEAEAGFLEREPVFYRLKETLKGEIG